MGRIICIRAEIDLGNIDTDDLVDELKKRKYYAREKVVDVTPSIDSDLAMREIYYAFKFGMQEKTFELTRAYVNDKFGCAI